MTAYPQYGRLDPLAVIATELQAAADGDATAIATIIQAAHEMSLRSDHGCARLTYSNGYLVERYHAAREALNRPDQIAQVSVAMNRPADPAAVARIKARLGARPVSIAGQF